MRSAFTGLLCLIASLPLNLYSQQLPDTAVTNVISIPDKISHKYISAVSEKSDKLSSNIHKQTDKYLEKLQKQETKIRKKLYKVDSVAANNIFANSEKKYQQLQNDIQNKAQNILRGNGQYIPWLDTASTTLKYLESNNPVIGKIASGASQAKLAIAKLHGLEDEFKKAENVKEFIRQRKEYFKQRLANYDLGSELKNYNQTAYYYAQQVNEYKAAMDDPEKIEKKALDILNKIPAFQDFMKKNSMLAGLFNIPDNYGTSSVAGLQTRSQVQQLISSQTQIIGPNGQQIAQQNISAAQAELSKLRDKFTQTGSGGEMPDFKPNGQKTKTFLQRIEYGFNMQTARGAYSLPTNTDFGLSIGYKINDNSSIGIGASYKMGWGAPIKHIQFSTQGLGLRSYIDVRLKKDFFATGGFEYNYQPLPASIVMGQAWQKSGLIGISKSVPIKSQFFKNTKLQLLWDFLSYSQVPRANPIVFRVGYNF